ncbi:MAG: D-glycero-beta-D-manno-heptose 1-phosphate adenylyltransferase [Actinomycetota bacterium]|nr:D-glycero-beta-D-manno-heptose 1-phosphate adenylyltransferase [Actinomycetota bacterium]
MSSGSRLVVLGDTLLDSDITGTVSRLCPDAPVPVVDLSTQCQRPGGAGLAALLAARAGHQVTLVTALGNDSPGRLLADLLAADVDVVAMPLQGATVCKTRVRTAGRSLLRIDSGDGRAATGPIGDSLDHTVLDALRDACAVLVADYGRGVTAVPRLRVGLAELACRVPVVWDPHPHGGSPVPGCCLITPNEREATGFASAADGPAAAVVLRQRWQCSAVAMTLGARGALLTTSTGSLPVSVPDIAVAPGSDTCGAGDAFAAAVTGALLDNRCITEAVTVAVGAASQFVADGGVGSIGSLAMGSGMTAPVSAPAGPVARSVQDIAARARRRGGRLVATGGCFDLLHPGHLSLLRQARALGDGLVVCLNSDESVRRLKGPSRPIVPAAGRIALLEALEPVDAVAVFNEDTPAELLAQLRPDIWVKGGDYTVADLPEAPLVSRYGGQTVIIPLVEGYSTSRLVAAAQDRS